MSKDRTDVSRSEIDHRSRRSWRSGCRLIRIGECICRGGVLLLAALLVCVGAVVPAVSAEFELIKIANQYKNIPSGTGKFTGFRTTVNTSKMVPTISGRAVVFVGYGNWVTLPSGRFAKQTGIYHGTGGKVRKIVDMATPVPECGGEFQTFFTPSKSGGHVAFRAITTEAEQGIFRVHDGQVSAIACSGPGGTEAPDYPGATFMTFGEPSVDKNGTVVFRGGTDKDPLYVPVGLYKSSLGGGGLQVITDRSVTNDPVFVSFGAGGTNTKIASIDNGVTAFLADAKLYPGQVCGGCLDGFAAKESAIWIYDGQSIEKIVHSDTWPKGAANFISSLGLPDIDRAGRIVFWANTAGYQLANQGIYRYYRGRLKRIADFDTVIPGTDQTFGYFGGNGHTPGHHNPSIDGNIIAFQGAPDMTLMNIGIYAWVKGELVKVVAPGDRIGNKTVTDTYLGYEAVSNGSIALMVQLRSGSGKNQLVVYRADLLPKD
jgi:hypothetical protein